MKNAIVYTVMFLAIQFVVSASGQGLLILLKGRGAVMDGSAMIAVTAVFGLVVIAVFLLARWAVVSRHWIRTRPWTVLFWCVIAALGVLIPSAWLQEQMPEMPNVAEQQFDMILKDRLGYLAVGLMAPLAEEVVFRGAVLRSLLQWNSRPWLGIAISAALFAIVHMNPAQMPHAFLVGLLLGWMYWRTDSIVPGVVYHWINNTVAYVMYNLYPSSSLTLVDLFGSQRSVLMALGFSLCIFLPALYQLNLRLRK